MSETKCKGCLYYDITGKCGIGIPGERDHFLFITHCVEGDTVLFATPCRVVHQMLTLTELKPGEVVYDLGSGDGRIVMLAAGKFGARAVGFELEEELVRKSLRKVLELHLEDRVKIVKDDLLNADVGEADVVTMYLSPGGIQEVKPKLERELRPRARVVSLGSEIPGWKPHRVRKVVDDNFTYTIYVYKK